MTPKDKLTAALEALDRARRTIEELAGIDTGDKEIDQAVIDAGDDIEIHLSGLYGFQTECV